MNKCKVCDEDNKEKLVRINDKYYRNWCKECYNISKRACNRLYARRRSPEVIQKRKEWSREYSKAYKLKNQTKLSDGGKRYHKNVRTFWLRLLNDRKLGECSICGYNKCFKAIEFHHKDPKEKECIISKLLYLTPNEINIDRLLKELDKCVVVCANCHRELHATETEKIGDESR